MSGITSTATREGHLAAGTRLPPGREPAVAPPRLGFLGVGWIGRQRMRAVAESGLADVAAIADSSRMAAEQALAYAPGALVASSLDELLGAGIDGLVIATPSARHASPATAALERGIAVFCQKPLGRTAAETRRVVEAARAADRLLGVDFSYRFTAGMRAVRSLVRNGSLGAIYAVELVFHNAYGPDKAWFYDLELAGGGCVMDLGVHLVDLALWTLDFPEVVEVSSRLFAGGEPLSLPPARVEDHALARLDLSTGATIHLACSWRASTGCDAVIGAAFYGTQGGAAMRNVAGSFYDFLAERYAGMARQVLAEPPEDWGGRAIIDWASRLARGEGFDGAAARFVTVAAALDLVYGR